MKPIRLNYTKIVSYSKNLSSYFGASIIPMLFNLAINPLIAMNMSPEDYAISGYYSSFSSLILPIIGFYLTDYYIKEYFRRDEEGRKQIFATVAQALVLFSGFVSLICFGLIFSYIKLFNHSISFPISPYLAFVVFSLPFVGLFNLQLAKFRIERRANSYFKWSVLNGVLLVILNLLFVVVLKCGAYGKLIAPLIGNIVVFIIVGYKLRYYLKIKIKCKQFKTIFLFCWPLALSAMHSYFTSGYTTTYLESIGDNTNYGIYVVGASIGLYLTVFSTAIGTTFQPDIYEAAIKKQMSRFYKVSLAQIFLISAIVLIFIFLAPFIISILTANRYLASVPFAQIIALSAITQRFYYIINSYCIATNHPKLYLYTSILGSIFIVIAMPFAVDKYSFIGGCWISVISYLIYGLITVVLLGFSHKISK